MTTDTASPLRQRMIEDMNARKFCADTAAALPLLLETPAAAARG